MQLEHNGLQITGGSTMSRKVLPSYPYNTEIRSQERGDLRTRVAQGDLPLSRKGEEHEVENMLKAGGTRRRDWMKYQ